MQKLIEELYPMILIGLLLALLFGYSLVNYVGRKRGEMEKWGISYLIGIGGVTVGMYILDIVGIPITQYSIYGFLIIGIIGFNIPYFAAYRRINFKKAIQTYYHGRGFPGLTSGNMVWVLLFLLVVFLTLASAAKGLYWPPTAYDNVTGYDLMAKVLAAEGTFDNSLFGADGKPIQGSAKRLIYPPMVSGSFAYAYLHDLQTSKISTVLYLVFFVISFYALLLRETNYMNAIIGTLFCLITPEFFAFTNLATTNIPFAIFASIGFIYLYFWTQNHRKGDLYLSALFLGLSSWTRNEGIVFIFLGLLVVLFITYRKSLEWKKKTSRYLALSLPFFLAWTLYVKLSFDVQQSVFYLYPYFDWQKLSIILTYLYYYLTSTQLFGLTIYAFVLALLLNFNKLKTDRATVMAGLAIASLLLLTLLYYQIDFTQFGSLKSVMRASYRRGLFCFIPLFWFYVASSTRFRQMGQWLNHRLERPGY